MNHVRTAIHLALGTCLGAATLVPGVARAQGFPQPSPNFYWNYGVKFVCGEQRVVPGKPGEPPVKPGNYATEINIHNFQWAETPVHKRVIFLVEHGEPVGREPKQAKPKAFDHITLAPANATMDDCNRIWQIAFPNVTPPSPMPLMIGFLVLTSPRELEVDAVYTAEVPGNLPPGTQPTGISIDVERVHGKRVALPHHGLPDVTPVPEGRD